MTHMSIPNTETIVTDLFNREVILVRYEQHVYWIDNDLRGGMIATSVGIAWDSRNDDTGAGVGAISTAWVGPQTTSDGLRWQGGARTFSGAVVFFDQERTRDDAMVTLKNVINDAERAHAVRRDGEAEV
jgi:hypothetical protein